VLRKVHLLHTWEREWLVKLLEDGSDPTTLLGKVNVQQVRENLSKYRSIIGTGVGELCLRIDFL